MMASTTNTKTAPSKCILHGLPPEIREMVFIQAAFVFFEVRPHCRWLLQKPGVPGWKVLLLMGNLGQLEIHLENDVPELERALFGEKSLYAQCVEARLSVSTLMLYPSAFRIEGEGEVTYPLFGREIPLRVLESIRLIRYATW
jgi:hypothetical protein